MKGLKRTRHNDHPLRWDLIGLVGFGLAVGAAVSAGFIGGHWLLNVIGGLGLFTIMIVITAGFILAHRRR